MLGFENMMVVDSMGKGGGLALLWMTDSGVEIQNYSRRHINAKVCSSPGGPSWKLTGFYGQPEASKRQEAWNLLRHIAHMEPIPWICLGDFNEILCSNEKFGGKERQRGLMEAFQNTLEGCGLSDLGYKGPKFTWTNCREDTEFIKERLDRAVANHDWCESFQGVEVLVGVAICSNHSPIFVCLKQKGIERRGRRKFRFEAGWEINTRCRAIIEQSWKGKNSQTDPWRQLSCKLETCKNSLMRW